MSDDEQSFIKELETEIGHHPNKQEIIAEYKRHIYEILKEYKIENTPNYHVLVDHLGTPREIAKMWRQESSMTPRNTQWLFVLCNVLIFVGGTLLMIFYNIFEWHWLEQVWRTLTEASFIIMLIYILFWGLIGYEIGKEFGHRGRRLLKKTFIISIIPNLLLLYLVVFKILPYDWFQPLLNFPFIIASLMFTGFLYLVSLIGYRWGRRVSV